MSRAGKPLALTKICRIAGKARLVIVLRSLVALVQSECQGQAAPSRKRRKRKMMSELKMQRELAGLAAANKRLQETVEEGFKWSQTRTGMQQKVSRSRFQQDGELRRQLVVTCWRITPTSAN